VSAARVGIVRCSSYDRDEVRAAVARAVELLGGAGRFLPPAGNVLLKPNLLGPLSRRRRAATDPEIVRAVAEVFREAGAGNVRVGDSPAVGTAGLVMSRAGYGPVLPEWVERIAFSQGRRCPVPGHADLELAAAALDAGCLVNIPKLKTHSYMGLTAAVKNLFGAVVGPRKAQWHLRAGENRRLFARLVARICYALRPPLSVLDAVVAMEGPGPSNGTPREVGLVLSADDPAALDAVVCALLGYRPEEVPVLAECAAAGLGATDLAEIEILGEPLEDVAVTGWKRAALVEGSMGIFFRGPLARVAKRALTSRPEISEQTCRRCGKCVEICPPKAMTLDPATGRPPEIDRAGCIRCFCCQEVCPHGAVEVRPGWLLRLGAFFRRRR
jgi:uncharacterized protein (DUF362 family)/ferredoxin